MIPNCVVLLEGKVELILPTDLTEDEFAQLARALRTTAVLIEGGELRPTGLDA